MSPSHEPWLVALSLLMAFQGSYVGLRIARGVGGAGEAEPRRRIVMAALALALGVWTMHFVGMLAARLPAPVDFLVLPTLLSFLVCVLMIGVAVALAALGPPSPARLALAAALMGGGVVAMHWLGMQALHGAVAMAHRPAFVVASAAIGVAASGAALWFGFGRGARGSVIGAAAGMALAIAAMHYTAMAGTLLGEIERHATPGAPALSSGLLASVVSVVAFVVTGSFLLTLVPERVDVPAAGAATAPKTVPQPRPPAALPVEKDGMRRALDGARIVAVQADGRYTTLFDGQSQWFCPLSITEVERCLDPAVFARIHRSHIVNLDRVTAMRRRRDAGLVSLAGETPYQAPVARGRQGWLRERLDRRAAETGG